MRRWPRSTPPASSPGHGPDRCEWPQITCAARDVEPLASPRGCRAGSRGAARRARGWRSSGPRPARLSAEHRRAVADAERDRARGRLWRSLAVSVSTCARTRRRRPLTTVWSARWVSACIQAYSGAQHRLVVVRRRAVLGQLGRRSGPSCPPPGARTSGPWRARRRSGRGARRRRRAATGRGRRTRGAPAAPPRPGARRAARPARARSAARARGSPAGSLCSRASIQPAASPWSWLPASTISSLAGPERLAHLGEERRGDVHRVAVRGLAQLEPVAEDHATGRRSASASSSGAPQVGAAQEVGLPRAAEVEV